MIPIRIHRFLLFLIIVFTLGARLCAQLGPLHGVDSMINTSMHDWKIPGLAVAIVKNDSVLFSKGFGVREVGKNLPVTDTTLFGIASLTKAFTAAAVGLLVDEGKMKWDDPVVKYLPGFQLYDSCITGRITLRDLLAHRSGIPTTIRLWYGAPISRSELVGRLRYLKPATGFRNTWTYNNILFLAAGEAVAHTAGTSWDEFVRERVFLPLGMAHTFTSTDSLTSRNDTALPHAEIDGNVQAIPRVNVDNIGPAASIISNVRDMAQWVRLQLNEGTFNGKRIISAATICEMHSPQIPMPDSWGPYLYNPDANFISYGLGWTLDDYRGRKVVEHTGELNGMTSVLAMIPEERLGVVLLSNCDYSGMGSLRYLMALKLSLFDKYIAGPGRDWMKELARANADFAARRDSASAKVILERRRGTKPTLQLESYASMYENPYYGKVTIKSEAGRLVFSYSPLYTGPLTHWQDDTFRVEWPDHSLGESRITFFADRGSSVIELFWEGSGDFKRVLR